MLLRRKAPQACNGLWLVAHQEKQLRCILLSGSNEALTWLSSKWHLSAQTASGPSHRCHPVTELSVTPSDVICHTLVYGFFLAFTARAVLLLSCAPMRIVIQ